MTGLTGSLVFAALLPGWRGAVRPIYMRAGVLADAPGEIQTVPAFVRAMPSPTADLAPARRSAA
jgi:hypothetical protein